MSNIKPTVFAIILLLILVLLNANNALAFNNQEPLAEKQTVNAGLIIFPPFIQQEKNEECYGLAIEDLIKIFPSEKYNLNIYCASPSRIYRDFNEGFIDITINVKTTLSLASNVLYSKRPFGVLEVVLYSRDVEKPYTIAAIRSFDYSGQRQQLETQGFTFVELPNTKEAIAVFLRGGTDAILSYKGPFEHYMAEGEKNQGFSSLNVSFKQEFLTSTPTYFAVNKRNKFANELMKTIDDYFDNVQK